MSSFNWTTFTVRIPVQASIEKLYWCIATRSGMEYWFLRMSEFHTSIGALRQPDEFVSAGDLYTWLWHGWSDDVKETGTIIEANGNDLLRFSFGPAGNVTIKLIPNEHYTMIELTQENIPDDEEGRHQWHLGCKNGWTFYLTNLKSLVEGGLDLRNKNENIRSVVNA